MALENENPVGLLAGNWRASMITHGLDGPSVRSDDLRSVKRWIGDGRYMREEIAGPFGGKRHEKLTVLGFNDTRARFEFFTADNYDAVLLLYTSEAGAKPDAREIVMSVEYASPDKTGADGPATFVHMRTVIAIEDRNNHSLRNFYRTGGQPEQLFLEINYVREQD